MYFFCNTDVVIAEITDRRAGQIERYWRVEENWDDVLHAEKASAFPSSLDVIRMVWGILNVEILVVPHVFQFWHKDQLKGEEYSALKMIMEQKRQVLEMYY